MISLKTFNVRRNPCVCGVSNVCGSCQTVHISCDSILCINWQGAQCGTYQTRLSRLYQRSRCNARTLCQVTGARLDAFISLLVQMIPQVMGLKFDRCSGYRHFRGNGGNLSPHRVVSLRPGCESSVVGQCSASQKIYAMGGMAFDTGQRAWHDESQHIGVNYDKAVLAATAVQAAPHPQPDLKHSQLNAPFAHNWRL